MRPGKHIAGITVCLALASAGCDEASVTKVEGSPQAAIPSAVTGLECRAKDGKVGLSWNGSDGAYAYRIARSPSGAAAQDLGQASGLAFTDYTATPGVAYQYTVTPLGVDGEGGASGPCSVTAPSPGGPPAPEGVACRAKDGKVDVTWNATDAAKSYRVFRTGAGQSRKQIAETLGRVHADLALQNGFQYGYDVEAVDGRGRVSAPSSVCNATPGPRQAGAAPPAVTDLTCRGKNDKADLTFTPVTGASFYRVYRSDAGGPAAAVGETTGGVFAQFGLQLGTRYEFSVESIGPGGAASPRSAICALTASGRGTGPTNQPPRITSQPLTSALEEHVYYTTVSATDPEGGAIIYSLTKQPSGMEIDPASGFVRWIPDSTQVGLQVVEVRATDPAGAFDSQAFVVDAADFDEPPSITSIPGRYARSGEPYRYDVEAFDPEGKALTFAFGAPVPAGMTIDPASGLVQWTPEISNAGAPTIVVRAVDPSGAFATQQYVLSVAATPLDLVSPSGEVEVAPGETVDLRLVANQPQAGFGVEPLPKNASLEGDRFRFTPDTDQVGDLDLGFRAVVGDQQDVNLLTIKVRKPNRPPELEALGVQQVKEGESLEVAILVSDPDGDPLRIQAPGLSLPNAIFDEIRKTLVFAPNFEQAGSYQVTISASDARETVEQQLTIEVLEAEPPSEITDLVLDPVKSPTFAPSQTISGSIRGEIRPGAVSTTPFIVGLSPVSVRQGRRATVELTGKDTAFAAGEVSADFGPGIVVESLEVLSPTLARAVIGAYADAEIGGRTVRVTQPSGAAAAVVAFSVEPGAATLSGVLIDSFTQQPIAGARVAIQGLAGVSAVTDAQGRYALDGVPTGQQTVVIAGPNYEVARFALGFTPNAPVDLGSSVALDALARPFSAGGTLPRSATLASVLDRGINREEPDLDYAQLRASVVDALLAIGGTGVGVVDEAGNQLNPEFIGPGMLNMKPAGVDFLAQRLALGETYSLDEVIFLLTGTFGWIFPDLGVQSVLAHMQDMVNLAWAAPGHPTSVELILLFNKGRTLDPKPPRLTPETRVNSFQAFLLAMGFLSKNFDVINDAVDQMLVLQGKDPAAVLQQYGFDPELYAGTDAEPSAWGSLAASGAVVLEVAKRIAFGAEAHAASGPTGPPNSVKKPGVSRRLGSGFQNVFNVNSIGAAVFAGVVGFAVAGFFAMIGLFGGLAAFGVAAALTAFGASFVSALIAKFVIGFVTADQELSMVPEPPVAVATNDIATEGQDKIRLQFKKSPTEIARDQKIEGNETYLNEFGEILNVLSTSSVDPRYLDFRYHLWKVAAPPAEPVLGGPGSQLFSTRSQPVHSEPELNQFVVPVSQLEIGDNFFVIVTVQFYRRLFGVDPDEPQFTLLYPDLGVSPPPTLEAAATTGVPQNVGSALPKPWGLEIPVNNLQQFIDQKRVAAEAAAALAREKAAKDGQAQRAISEKLESEATAKSNLAENLRTDIAAREAKIKDLKQRIKVAAEPTKLELHQSWRSELDRVLKDPKTTGRPEAEFLAELRNPQSELGRRTEALVAGAGGQEAFEKVATQEWRLATNEASKTVVTDARLNILAARAELADAIAKVQGGAAGVDLPGVAPQAPVLADGNPPRVVDYRPLDVPPKVTQESLDAANQALASLDAEVTELTKTAKDLAGSRGGRVTQLKRAVTEAQERLVSEPVREALEELQKELLTVESEHKSVLGQQEALKTEAGKLRGQAQEAIERATEKELASAAPPTLPPKPQPSTSPKRFFSKDFYTKFEGIDSTAPGGRYKFGVGLSEAVGVIADIGIEAFGARNNVLVMRSQTSERIHVRVLPDGTPVLPPPDQVLAAIQRGKTTWSVVTPEEVGLGGGEIAGSAPMGEHLARSARPFVPSETVLSDSGVPAGMDPQRWERRLAALRHYGWLPRSASVKASTGYPVSFEMDADTTNFLGLLHPTPPSGPTGKAGFLVRDFPFTAATAQVIDAGFPSDLIAVDSDGLVYLENLNSNAAYGGRIFRYFGSPLSREHVGSASYYSLDLQYARPTQPVAMEVAQAAEGGENVEDVFLAELDPGVYFAPGIQPQNRILRVGTSQADRNPYYANGQNRNRIVGQTYATHPDFQMTGPSDMERDRVVRFGNGPLNLYFSDEENIFAISDSNRDGAGEVAKVVSVPGRRFAGLAVDTGGNLLFVDHAAGEVFALSSFELNVILASGVPIVSDAELDARAILLKPGLRGASDIELDTWEERYIVSTEDGFQAFDVPMVGRLSPDVAEIKVDIRGRELPVTLRRDRGNVFIVGSGSDAPLGKTVRLRVRVRDPQTGESAWQEHSYLNGAFGVSFLPGVL